MPPDLFLFTELLVEVQSTDESWNGCGYFLLSRGMLLLLPIDRSKEVDRILPRSDSGDSSSKTGRQDGRQAPIIPMQGSIDVQIIK